MNAWSGPLGSVGGTVLPFLIPGNTEKCRENGFVCLYFSTQIQTLEPQSTGAALLCLEKPYKGLHKINGVTLGHLCTTHNMRKWSRKPPRKNKNLYTIPTRVYTSCKQRIYVQKWLFSFIQQFFRVGRMEKQAGIVTYPSHLPAVSKPRYPLTVTFWLRPERTILSAWPWFNSSGSWGRAQRGKYRHSQGDMKCCFSGVATLNT